MRVGIIGGGFGLNVQAPMINIHPMMEVIAVCTMHRHRLPQTLLRQKNSPIHYKNNWQDMLDKEPLDLLFVSSLPIHHFDMVKSALEKRIHVVCEKPFTVNSKESKALLELAYRYEMKVIIDFEWRFLPHRQKIKELIQNEQIGKVIHFEYHISSPQYEQLQSNKRGWMGEKKHFGGMLGALGTHMIDSLRWFVHDEVDIIQGLVHTHVPQGAGEFRDADDAFFLHGKMKNKVTFSIQLLSGIHHGFGSQLKLYGSSGTIHLIDDKKLCIGKANKPFEEIQVHTNGEKIEHLSIEANAYYPAFYPFLENVYEYIMLDKRNNDLPTILDGHENQIVLENILKTNITSFMI